ncbi:hypothetical protein K435DRAFT_478217 [Dendrothele bispora CBS 962.96]|uniref:Uncharacterized protein n=1 Tax=Dendrothele bispora (strain CBS 962.96) TaxID=1314807 RepID=A0A4S8KZ58_DENBC|nr:hypothetical protein K435DRAFT_478217 [Dendrothele bispora CBS 962.96]
MSRPYSTRGNKVTIPKELEKRKKEDIQAAKAEREKEKARQKEEKEAAKVAKAASRKRASKVVAAAQDQQALEDKALESIRPDLELEKRLPRSRKTPITEVVSKSLDSDIVLSSSDSDHDMAYASHSEHSGLPPSSVCSDSEFNSVMEVDSDDDKSDEYHPPSGESAAGDDEIECDLASEANVLAGLATAPSPGAEAGEDGSSNGEDGSGGDDEEEDAIQEFLKKFRAEKQSQTQAAKKRKSVEKNKLTRQEQKSVVRNEVDIARVYKPKSLVNAGPRAESAVKSKSGSLKRGASSDAEDSEEIKKRPKGPVAGGLKPGWKKTAAVLSQNKTTEREMVTGEFDKDESVDALVQARGAAGKGSSEGSKMVSLTTADVLEIDARERAKDIPKPKRRTGSKTDLPFPGAAQREIWEKKIVPGVLKWAGSVKSQFGVNNHPELKTTIHDLWNRHLPPSKDFPALYTDSLTGIEKARVDHPAVINSNLLFVHLEVKRDNVLLLSLVPRSQHSSQRGIEQHGFRSSC